MSTSHSAVKYVPAGTGRTVAMIGDTLTFKDEPRDNGDALLLFEHHLPATLGVPPHTEPNHEAFYVLEGTLEVEVAGQGYRLGPGDFLGIPPGVVHSLRNPGPDPVRTLTVISPGSRHEQFFSTFGTPVADPANPPPSEPPDFGRLAAIARECGIEFLPPPRS